MTDTPVVTVILHLFTYNCIALPNHYDFFHCLTHALSLAVSLTLSLSLTHRNVKEFTKKKKTCYARERRVRSAEMNSASFCHSTNSGRSRMRFAVLRTVSSTSVPSTQRR